MGAIIVCATTIPKKLNSQTNIFPPSGNTGIGTLSPIEKLHVIGGIRSYKDGDNSINPQLYLGNYNNNRAFSFQLNADGSSLNLWTYNPSLNWQNKFTFKTNGILGIGTDNPQAYLHVKGADHGPGIIVEPGNSTEAYGVMVQAKHNYSKSFVVQNHVDAPLYESFTVFGNGRTKIGRASSTNHYDAMLSVAGKIVCQDFYVTEIGDWPDYVFSKNYTLKNLDNVKNYYSEHKHLPGVPSAKEIEEKGLNLPEISKIQMEKIEESIIYIVQLKEEIEKLKEEIEKLKDLKLQKNENE